MFSLLQGNTVIVLGIVIYNLSVCTNAYIKRNLIIKYLIKVLNQPDHEKKSITYNLIELITLKNILDEIGMTNLWMDQKTQTTEFRTVNQRILNIHK